MIVFVFMFVFMWVGKVEMLKVKIYFDDVFLVLFVGDIMMGCYVERVME